MILICSLIWETLTQILLLHRQKLLAQGQLQRPASASGARWPLPSQPVTDIAPHALCHAGLGTSAVSTLPGREVFPFPGGVRRVKKRSLFQAPSMWAVGIYMCVRCPGLCQLVWGVEGQQGIKHSPKSPESLRSNWRRQTMNEQTGRCVSGQGHDEKHPGRARGAEGETGQLEDGAGNPRPAMAFRAEP